MEFPSKEKMMANRLRWILDNFTSEEINVAFISNFRGDEDVVNFGFDGPSEHGVAVTGSSIQFYTGFTMSHDNAYSPSSVSSSGGVNPSSFIPRERPISTNTSLISFNDFLPKFFVFSISASVLLTS